MNYLSAQNIFDVVIVLGGVAFIFAQVNLGKSQRKSADDSDALVTLRLKDQTISTLQTKIKDLEASVVQDGKDIAVLQAENAQLKAYNSSRNPELETLMKQVLEALSKQTVAINALLAKPPTTVINNQTPL